MTLMSQMGCTFLERVKGIEPSYEAWEAAVLPLNYTRKRTHFTSLKLKTGEKRRILHFLIFKKATYSEDKIRKASAHLESILLISLFS